MFVPVGSGSLRGPSSFREKRWIATSLLFLDRFSERVSSELRVDGSGYVIPFAMDLSYHTEDINPFLICVLCDEDGFQDFFVQECRRADF